MTVRLVSLAISPWSERARWALDHHKIAYQKIQHVPFLGEGKLRRLAGVDKKKRATAPLLLTDTEPLTDSWDIARWADAHGKETPLIANESDVRTWNTVAEEAMTACRALVVTATLKDPHALDENQPPSVPRWLYPLVRPVARTGTTWFARKYGVRAEEETAHRATLRGALQKLKAALTSSGYVLGTFSYADVVMATVLQGVVPVDHQYIRLGPATRRAWTQSGLATEFAELVAWRDRIYTQHRR